MTSKNQTTKKCGYMILTPHYDSGHNGGMWCAEDYPCPRHGEWEKNKQTPVTTVSSSISHGMITHPVGELCKVCDEMTKTFEKDLANGKVAEMLGKPDGLVKMTAEEQERLKRWFYPVINLDNDDWEDDSPEEKSKIFFNTFIAPLLVRQQALTEKAVVETICNRLDDLGDLCEEIPVWKSEIRKCVLSEGTKKALAKLSDWGKEEK